MPASIAICLSPLAVSTLLTIRGGNKECISLGWLSSLSFQRIFRSLTLCFVRMRSSCCQLVRCGPPPSVSQFAVWPNIESAEARKQLSNCIYDHGPVMVLLLFSQLRLILQQPVAINCFVLSNEVDSTVG